MSAIAFAILIGSIVVAFSIEAAAKIIAAALSAKDPTHG